MKIGTSARAGIAALALVACTAVAQDSPSVTAGRDGFALSSADNAWQLRLRGLIHMDGRWFFDESALLDDDSEWLLRRVRPSFEGQFGARIAFRLMPDFGGGDSQLVDAYVDTVLGAGVTLRAGKFKVPVGLERLQSSDSLRMVERSYVTELLPNRDIGAQLSGGASQLQWAAGLFNGVDDGRSGDQDDDGNQEVALRLFSELFGSSKSTSVFGIGVGASYGRTEGSATGLRPLLSGYRSPGQNTVFVYRSGSDGTFADGERLRLSPQFYWYRGPVGLMGEWARVRQDVRRIAGGVDRHATLDHDAWQVTAEWFLTGDQSGFRDPETAGAVQLVARISRLSIDDDAFAMGEASFANPQIAVRTADTWGAGVNWRPLEGLKASFVYQQSSFEGGAPTGDRRDEKVLFVRLQHDF
jgi:phosphate-selective porin OprO and OprP